MSYIALYRRWRPQDFDSLIGQKAIKIALSNAIQTNRIAHAYLFSGPRGTGKTSTARIFAKALNCNNGPTLHPCNQCTSCEQINNGTSMDIFEIDAASNRGIDEIKALREKLAFAPVNGQYKIYIIDEVHMLTTESFNALLKTLEEPPAHVIFILATTDPQKIPATIHSRCQRFDFKRVTVDEITEHLAMIAEKSYIKADKEALRLIAVQSEGGMRDALSMLDQCSVMSDHITIQTVQDILGIVGKQALNELLQAIGKKDVPEALEKMNFILEQGRDNNQLITEIAEYMRALLIFKSAPDYSEIYLTDTKEAFEKIAPLFSQNQIINAEERLHQALKELKTTLRPKITSEICIIDLTKPSKEDELESLKNEIQKLKNEIKSIKQSSFQVQTVSNQNINQNQEEYDNCPTDDELAELYNTPHSLTQNNSDVTKKKPAITKQEQNTEINYYINTETATSYWNLILKNLKETMKISVFACAQNGKAIGVDDNNLYVAFKSEFTCNRIQKYDYKAIIDKTSQILPETKKVVFLKERELPKLQEISKTETAKSFKQEISENEVSGTTKKALNILGGKIYKI